MDRSTVCRSLAATPLPFSLLSSAVVFSLFAVSAAWAEASRVCTPNVIVSVSGVAFARPVACVVMVYACDPRPGVGAAAAGLVLPPLEQPTNATRHAANPQTTRKQRFIRTLLHPGVDRRWHRLSHPKNPWSPDERVGATGMLSGGAQPVIDQGATEPVLPSRGRLRTRHVSGSGTRRTGHARI